jgi:hypothetical protein
VILIVDVESEASFSSSFFLQMIYVLLLLAAVVDLAHEAVKEALRHDRGHLAQLDLFLLRGGSRAGWVREASALGRRRRRSVAGLSNVSPPA